MTLSMCIAILEGRHGSARKAAKYYGLDKGYWKRLRDGEKKNPSDFVLASLGIERRVNYVLHIDGKEVSPTGRTVEPFLPKPHQIETAEKLIVRPKFTTGDINADLAKVYPPKRVSLSKTAAAKLDLHGWQDAMGTIDISHLIPCTEGEMLAHLVQFKGRGVGDPNYKRANGYSAQWKCNGPWYWWQKGSGRIEAAMNTALGLYAVAAV